MNCGKKKVVFKKADGKSVTVYKDAKTGKFCKPPKRKTAAQRKKRKRRSK